MLAEVKAEVEVEAEVEASSGVFAGRASKLAFGGTPYRKLETYLLEKLIYSQSINLLGTARCSAWAVHVSLARPQP